MSVTIDHELFAAEAIGLQTVGQVLTHLQGFNRLIVNLLIDGEEPDLSLLGKIRRTARGDHTVYIETANPGAWPLKFWAKWRCSFRKRGRSGPTPSAFCVATR